MFLSCVLRELFCRILRKLSSHTMGDTLGWLGGWNHTGKRRKTQKRKYARKNGKKRKEWYSALASDVVFLSRLIDNYIYHFNTKVLLSLLLLLLLLLLLRTCSTNKWMFSFKLLLIGSSYNNMFILFTPREQSS